MGLAKFYWTRCIAWIKEGVESNLRPLSVIFFLSLNYSYFQFILKKYWFVRGKLWIWGKAPICTLVAVNQEHTNLNSILGVKLILTNFQWFITDKIEEYVTQGSNDNIHKSIAYKTWPTNLSILELPRFWYWRNLYKLVCS